MPKNKTTFYLLGYEDLVHYGENILELILQDETGYYLHSEGKLFPTLELLEEHLALKTGKSYPKLVKLTNPKIASYEQQFRKFQKIVDGMGPILREIDQLKGE